MLKNSFSYDAIYNQGLVMIDAKLKELENRISENKENLNFSRLE